MQKMFPLFIWSIISHIKIVPQLSATKRDKKRRRRCTCQMLSWLFSGTIIRHWLRGKGDRRRTLCAAGRRQVEENARSCRHHRQQSGAEPAAADPTAPRPVTSVVAGWVPPAPHCSHLAARPPRSWSPAVAGGPSANYSPTPSPEFFFLDVIAGHRRWQWQESICGARKARLMG
jgi:hypothetical protein